jgi:hypothetical protein
VDRGRNGAILNAGGEGGPARLVGEEVSSWYRTAEMVRHSQDDRRQRRRAQHGIKAPLCTDYVSLYALTCRILMIVVMSSVLLVYLFQENKSYGSRNHLHSSSGVQESRVGHRDDVDIINIVMTMCW